MIPLCVLLVLSVILMVRIILSTGKVSRSALLEQTNYVKYLGILALTLGMLGQIIGLYSAFEAIESIGNVSPAMFYGGMRVSSITTITGVLIFIINYIGWMLIKLYVNFKEQDQ